MTPAGAEYTDLTIVDAFDGSAAVEVNATDNEINLVIVSVPEHFGGNQTFGYEYRIE